MRKEKSRDAARSRRSKENHEFYELAKLLPLPAAITSQLDFLDKASIIRLTISFLKLRQFSVNGHPPWAPDFTTLGSINPYSSQSLNNYAELHTAAVIEAHSRPTSAKSQTLKGTYGSQTLSTVDDLSDGSAQLMTPSVSVLPSSAAFANSIEQAPSATTYRHLTPVCHAPNLSGHLALAEKKHTSLFDIHQGTHILQSLDGFAFAIGRDGRFLYISETVSMYLGLSQVEMTGSSVFDYTHQQDHEELAKQLGIPYTLVNVASGAIECSRNAGTTNPSGSDSPQPASVHSQYSIASNETLIEEHVNSSCPRKRAKTQANGSTRGAYGRTSSRRPLTTSSCLSGRQMTLKIESEDNMADTTRLDRHATADQSDLLAGTLEDPLVRQFCIRMKSTLTKRGCQHFKSSGYRVVHVVAHLRSYQSNDHGHLMDPLDDQITPADSAFPSKQSNNKRRCAIRAPSSSIATKSESQITGSDKCSPQEHCGANSATNSSDPSDDNSRHQAIHSSPMPKIIGMVAVAIALPPPSINELKLESDTFVLRLSLDLRITHIEPRISELLHFPVESIAGKSLYSIVHPADVGQVQKCHRDLLKKGQMMSGYYRILSRTGGYIWVQTCATLICSSNMLAAQSPAILSSSPLPTCSNQSTSQQYLSQTELQCKVTNYLPTQVLTSQEQQQQPHSYQQQTSKVASPGLSSHLSSSFEQPEQDQCIIFVNYMITSTVDGSDILDVCQCADYQTLSSSFSGGTSSSSALATITPSNHANNPVQINHHNEATNQFSSPSSSCSSPCLKNMSAPGSNNNSNHYISRSYVPSVASINSGGMNLSTLKRQVNQFCDTKHKDKSPQYNHRRSSNSSGKSKATVYSNTTSESEPNIVEADRQNMNSHATSWPETSKTADNNHYESASTNEAHHIYNYGPTLGNVNMALTCVNGNTKSQVTDPSWLNHHQSAAVVAAARLSDPAGVYVASQQTSAVSDPYASMNRSSLYKAAFGLEVSGTSATSNYQSANYSNTSAGGYPSSTASNPAASWDTSAAEAAVAAASNLSNHHPTNPYAHLDTHHPAGLNSATGGHHNPGPYYNYYGYYGNKFI